MTQWPSIDRSELLREKVSRALEDLIVAEGLQPGERLVETELARRLGVSRNPIRESLQLLARDGLVDLTPGRGAQVHLPTPDEVEHVFSVRRLLECEAARLAAHHASPAEVDELRAVVERGSARAEADADAGTLAELNIQLHSAIFRAAGNPVLAQLWHSLEKRVRWYFAPVARSRGLDSWREHEDLIAAIARGDGDRAADLMYAHIDSTYTAFRDRFESPSEEPA
jgi:DNA-binding GntR family transcriptional regulator